MEKGKKNIFSNTYWENKRKCRNFVNFWTNMDKNFFGSEFHTDGFNYPYWVDHGEKGGGIMLLFREDLPLNIFLVDKGNEMVL